MNDFRKNPQIEPFQRPEPDIPLEFGEATPDPFIYRSKADWPNLRVDPNE